MFCLNKVGWCSAVQFSHSVSFVCGRKRKKEKKEKLMILGAVGKEKNTHTHINSKRNGNKVKKRCGRDACEMRINAFQGLLMPVVRGGKKAWGGKRRRFFSWCGFSCS